MTVENFPYEQSEHALLPFTSLYFPAPHPTHCPSSSPMYPALQVQFESDWLPRGADECCGHAVHAPFVSVYELAGQGSPRQVVMKGRSTSMAANQRVGCARFRGSCAIRALTVMHQHSHACSIHGMACTTCTWERVLLHGTHGTT